MTLARRRIRLAAALVAAIAGVWSCDKASGPAPPRVALVLDTAQLEQGDTTRATVLLSDWRRYAADTSLVTFSSGNTNVVRVGAGGLITAVGAGTTTISAVVKDDTGRVSVTVILTVGTVALVSPSAFDVGDSALSAPTVTSVCGLPVTGRTVRCPRWSSTTSRYGSTTRRAT